MTPIRLRGLFYLTTGASAACVALAVFPTGMLLKAMTVDSGRRVQTLIPWMQAEAVYLAVFFALAATAAWLAGRKPRIGEELLHLATLSPSPSSRFPLRDALGWLAFGGALVLAQDWRFLNDGYFHADDYELLAVARSMPLSDSVWLLHGVHSMPLMRVESEILRFFFGSDAFYYNVCNLSLFAVLFASMGLLLHELRVRTLASAGTVTLCAIHADWGAMTSGHYLQNVYAQGALFSLLAIICQLRWSRTCRSGWIVAMWLFAALGTFTDLAGMWVVPGILVFLAAHARGENVRLRELWGQIAGLVLVALAGAAYNYLAYRGSGEFLATAGAAPAISGRILALGYFFAGGLGVSWALPLYYHVLHLKHLLLPPLLLAGGAWIALLVLFFRSAPKNRCWTGAGIIAILLGIGAMVVSGRSFDGVYFDGQPFTWPIKYTAPALVWSSVLLGLILERLLASEKRRLAGVQIILALVVFLPALHWVLGQSGSRADYAAGREAWRLCRISERDTFRDTQPLFSWVYGIEHGKRPAPLRIPTLDMSRLTGETLGKLGIRSIYPLPGYDLTYYREAIFPGADRVTLLRTPGMNPKAAADIEVVGDLPSSVSPEFVQALAKDERLRILYDGWERGFDMNTQKRRERK